MAIYTIGDLHLSVAAKKPMDIFDGWDNHAEKIIQNWQKTVSDGDTVVLAGDTSWGMSLSQALPDFRLIHNLPGKKVILKGNHDYWWGSVTKMAAIFAEHGFDSLSILHNNSYYTNGINICGSRGWLFESGEAHDEKIIRREAIRIEASLASVKDSGRETVMFLHYPPLYGEQVQLPFIDVMRKYGIKRCYYGHIHGAGHRAAIEGVVYGIEFRLVAADKLKFSPLLVAK